MDFFQRHLGISTEIEVLLLLALVTIIAVIALRTGKAEG
jgi:hypothetical protein